MKAIIVGAGLAGCAASLALEKHGYECTLIESSEKAGGRMRSTTIGEYDIDVGFHVLHTAYPTLERWLDLDHLELKPMDAATDLIQPSTGKISTLGDPLRSPSTLFPTILSAGVWNALRMLRWRLTTRKRDLENAMDRPSMPMDTYFHSMRFSKSFQSSFLQPLFAGITLDDERKERSAFASFTFSAMSHGSMTMPKKGIEAVPKQLLARLKSTNILYNTTVESLSKDSVKLADGTELKADIVILATPQHVAQKLLGITNTSRRKETATYVFECQQTPLKRARLLLNTEYGNGENKVLHVHVPTLLHTASSHLLVATVIGEHSRLHDQKGEQEKIRRELITWFGPDVEEWPLVGTTYVDYALPSSSTTAVGRERSDLMVNDVCCIGDYTMHPSVHGTLRSVERLLEHLEIPIPMKD
jgi:2-polyprenyl-6-methoxyphenol hydroxylase-like FAD-dependent oxidoreductase